MQDITLLQSSQYSAATASFLKYSDLTVKRADLKTLRRILAAFSKIPYENVSKIIRYNTCGFRGERMFRFPDELWEDYRHHSLGGTCFSLTFFLQSILENSGYVCYPVSADMKWGKHVHCGLVVILGQEAWFCDPGYLLAEPLLLSGREVKICQTPERGVMLAYISGSYQLATFNGNQSKWRYTFKNVPCLQADFVKWWLQSFEKPTMRDLCLTRQEPGGMVYVHNNYFREVTRQGIRKQRLEQNWINQIEAIFGIPVQMLKTAHELSRGKVQ
ncbi:MAG: arylamine N-acetyltransferase [Candidatus Cloacimonetes bacterium]|nr:arylamine N-acetyltransferase [Candidatus Cloacimonadota bacterium]